MTDKDSKSDSSLRKMAPDERPIAHAEIDRDSLKAFFHILVGKPDSTIQLFDGPFELGILEIENLNDQISRKIRNHNVETVNSSAYLSSSDRTIREFGAIRDLLNHTWNGAEETEEITLKWDFLINIVSYEIP